MWGTMLCEKSSQADFVSGLLRFAREATDFILNVHISLHLGDTAEDALKLAWAMNRAEG